MINLPSQRKEFQGFGAYYESDIEPYLLDKESLRKKAVGQFIAIVVVAVSAAALAIAFGPFGGEGNFKAGFVIGALGISGALVPLTRARNAIALGLLKRICGRLGFGYRRDLSRPAYYSDFDRLDLLPNFNREHWEDEVRGARDGAGFVICESHLKYKSSGKNSSTRTVFHGQLLVIEYEKKFLGETVIKRDAGLFNAFKKPGKKFQRVGIASAKFEKIYEAWSTDQVEARELLDPVVLERFEELDRLFDGAKLRAGFSQGKLYAALETGDKLNMGTMFKPLEGPTRVETILKQFDIIFDLIDVMVKKVDGRLGGAFSVEDVKAD